MNKTFTIGLLLITLIGLVGFSYAITDITLPVPEKETAGEVKISANNVSAQDGQITVSSKTLTIKLENIKTATDFYVSINKDLPKKISEIPSSNETAASPPFDYVKNELSKGSIFKVENIDPQTTKSFSINGWDGKNPVSISVCQDKNDDGDCEEQDENKKATISLKVAGPISCSSIRECLSALGKKVAGLVFD